MELFLVQQGGKGMSSSGLSRGSHLTPPRRALSCPGLPHTDTAGLEGVLERGEGCVAWEQTG